MQVQKFRTCAVVGDEAGPERGMEDIVRGFSHISSAIVLHVILFQFRYDAVDTGMTQNLCSDSNGHRAS